MRTIDVISSVGMKPVFIGRKLPDSKEFNPDYPTKRFKLFFTKGFLFYANYNLRLFWHLLWNRYDIYLSNDLDTLLPNYLISRLKNKPLVYDSHEYFLGVPEIQHRPVVKKVWSIIESSIFPRLRNVVTVNESIARLYQQDYAITPRVVRNIGDGKMPGKTKSRKELQLPADKFIMINQGAGINVDRGMEEAVASLKHLPPEVILLIVGNGDAVPGLKRMVENEGLTERAIFRAKQPYLELLQYTLNANCGLSLDKPTSLNYKYSLPNKLFDYFKCGLPVVVSEVVEVKNLVQKYNVGEVIASHNPQDIAEAVLKVKAEGKDAFAKNLKQVTAENNWGQEQKVWREIFSSLL